MSASFIGSDELSVPDNAHQILGISLYIDASELEMGATESEHQIGRAHV